MKNLPKLVSTSQSISTAEQQALNFQLHYNALTQFLLLIHVVEPLKVITRPQQLKDIVEGESAKFNIQAHGTEPLNYHWQWKPAEKESGSEKWQPCPANWSDGATLTVPKVEKLNEGIYRCVVSNLAGEQISNSAKLGVGKNLKFNGYHLV